MASIYIKAEVSEFVDHAIKHWHPDLNRVKVKIGTLFVMSTRETQPALKEGGHPVEGTIKIVPLKDRVTKDFDVEMLLDCDEWQRGKTEHRLALVDHLLSRLEVKKPKPKKKKKSRGSEGAVHGTDEERANHEEPEFMTDDSGRPMLKLRKGDWNTGIGFRDVVERHGRFSVEHRNLDRAQAMVAAVLKNMVQESETTVVAAV
jgi:hypothetical protein